MRAIGGFEFPPDRARILAKARRLEWASIAYGLSASAVLGVTMGASQAMRTNFFDDLIGTVPAVVFLAGARLATRNPSHQLPYGLHRAVSIGYLVAALALLVMGGLLLYEAVSEFAAGERTTIGAARILGHTMWAGWPMLVALAYTGIPPIFLGRAKLALASPIHDKVLYADAEMMKANWMAAGAAAVGVVGTGLGAWWLDPLAAMLVSIDIVWDGLRNLGVAVADLVERSPRKTDRSGPEPLPERLQDWMESLDWVRRAEVRLREAGHVFLGEVYVVPRTPEDLPRRVCEAMEGARKLDWRLHDVAVVPVERLD